MALTRPGRRLFRNLEDVVWGLKRVLRHPFFIKMPNMSIFRDRECKVTLCSADLIGYNGRELVIPVDGSGSAWFPLIP